VLEALRCDYPWACERFHRFVLDGMADNAECFGRAGVFYYPYVEPRSGAGKGLLAGLSRHACLVITDDFPAFMLPRMLEAAAIQSDVRMEAIDSNGVLPLSEADRAFSTAHAFRRFLQRELREHLAAFPKANPLARLQLQTLNRLPSPILKRWPKAPEALLAGSDERLRKLPIDRSVGLTATTGGPSSSVSTVTPKTGTSWTSRSRAGCLPTCTSAISPATRLAGSYWIERTGRSIGSAKMRRAAGKVGGGSAVPPKRFSTSS
jgi:deoxyribodipyrimidine photo-lyase